MDGVSDNLPEEKRGPDFAVYSVWQSRLPVMLGISIEEVRARRGLYLQEGKDWVRDGNRVLLTEEAVVTLRKSLCIALPLGSDGTGEAGGGAQGGGFAEEDGANKKGRLVVWRSAPVIRNQRIVECYREELGVPLSRESVVLVWVKDNTFFKRGRVLEGKDLEERQGGQFTYLGRLK
jgi:hypothetical protein